jgi:mannose-6-phosphate isomerase-like protein (cupin superfamily)
MYEEIRKDLETHFKQYSKTRGARWDLAIQKLLLEKSPSKKQPLTTTWLTKETGFSSAYISNVVTGKIKHPTTDKLFKIAGALKVSYLELTMRACQEYGGLAYHVTFNDRPILEYKHKYGFRLEVLSPPGLTNRDFFYGVMFVRPRRELKVWKFPMSCQVAMHVESGTLKLAYGVEEYTVKANEAIYFDAAVPHRLINMDDYELKINLVTNPPIF